MYNGFISHLDEVTRLSAEAVLLASNDFRQVQVIAVKHQKGFSGLLSIIRSTICTK